MDDTNTVTPPTLENMYVMAGQEFDRPVLQAEDRDNVEGRRDRGRCLAPVEASKTTDQDPLRNPAIPFQDREDSYTPTTLAEMLQQQESPAKRSRLRFFDLPREVRDLVYSHLLTPEGGFVMDFASCADCVHERHDYKSETYHDPDEPTAGRYWFEREWRRILAQVEAVPVSRQFYSEAIEIFYGQPFRFTGDCGWIMLYYFLKKLGCQKRRLLKDIAISHPGFASLPETGPLRQRLAGIPKDYQILFHDHMRAFRFEPGLHPPYLSWTHDAEWNQLQHPDGTAQLLAQCTGLARFTLTLPQFQYPQEQCTFRDLEDHPIHQFKWPQDKQLTRSILHLVSSRHDCFDEERFQPCFSEIFDGMKKRRQNQELYGLDLPLDCVRHYPKNWQGQHRDTRMLATRADEAHRFFKAVEKNGWKVKQELYDERGHYPVKEGQGCVNKKMCELLNDADAWGKWPACLGNTEEAMAHLDLDYLIWTHDGRLWGTECYDMNDWEKKERKELEDRWLGMTDEAI